MTTIEFISDSRHYKLETPDIFNPTSENPIIKGTKMFVKILRETNEWIAIERVLFFGGTSETWLPKKDFKILKED